jgi:glycosyltransferase involved in cell wall biosynthesis
MSRFPRLTETFVLYEIQAAEELGVVVSVYPLLRERAKVMHPEARQLLHRVRYLPFVSWPIVRSQFQWLRRAPGRYMSALWAVLRGTWGSARFLLGGLAFFPKVAHAARMMQADGIAHVHCHFASHPALAGFVIHRLTQIPFSFTAHAHDLFVDRHMLRQKVAESAFVVAISRYNRDCIVSECGTEYGDKVHVIHCGVDTTVFSPANAYERSDELSILCVGTLDPRKGQAHLVDSCRILAGRGVPFRCKIVGGAGDRHALEARVTASGLDGRVELVGWQTRPEIVDLMRAADVVVAPSVPLRDGRQEGIPVTLMEAMATGVPVVASAISGIPELVEDGRNGLLVAPADPDALADALEKLQSSADLRRRLGSAGREKVLRSFELRSNAADVIRHIKAVSER